MPAQHDIDTGWRKSSYSGGSGDNGNWVEGAATAPGVAVRGSKTTEPDMLTVSNHAWHAFATRAAPDTATGTVTS